MNILNWAASRLRIRSHRSAQLAPWARERASAMAEMLERRVLMDGTVNSQLFDAPGYADQNESTTLAFSPPGTNARTVVTAYNDASMEQFGMANGVVTHTTGWSYSNNGAASFSRSSNDPSNPPVLPYTTSADSYGDAGDPVLAFDQQNAALYLSTVGSYPNGEINVYRSNDYGNTFSSVMDATAATPGSLDVLNYDKPWITVDNYRGDSRFGTLYLAYDAFVGNNIQVMVTSLAPGATTWSPPQSNGAPPGVVIATGDQLNGPRAPQILVAPDHSVYVIWESAEGGGNAGLYAKSASDPTSQNAWDHSPLMLLQSLDHGGVDFNLQAQKPDGFYQDTIRGVHSFPSAVINTDAGTHIYVGYADVNSDNVTAGVYVLDWNLSSNSVQQTQVSQISQINDEWQPALTVSPTGSKLFVGFYGGNGVYVPPDDTSQYGYESYNTYGVIGGLDTSGAFTGFGTIQQLSNVDGSGLPTGNTFSSRRNGFLGDYDTASADIDNFYFGSSATIPETFSDNSTDPTQTDIHMAVVPYDANRPAVPNGVAFHTASGDNPPTITWQNADDYSSEEMYLEYSTPNQGWQYAGQGNLADGGTLYLYPSNFPMDPNTTYYFRLFAGNRFDRGGGPTSTYSLVVTASPQNTVITGNHIALVLDTDGSDIDATVDGRVYPPMPFSTSGNLILHGNGGSSDTISIDARLLVGSGSTVDDTGGAVALKVVGASTSDTVVIDGTNDYFAFDSSRVNFSDVTSIEYFDGGGGGDDITCYGPIPIILDVSGGDNITDNADNVTLNFY